MTRLKRNGNMGTKEHSRLDQLRELALASVEGNDPFRKQKVSQILSAETVMELREFLLLEVA